MFTPLHNPYFLFLLSSFLFQRCSNGHRAATLRREANTDCVPCSFGSQVSQSARWHAKGSPNSHSSFLMFLFSCSFLCHSLGHSNGIEPQSGGIKAGGKYGLCAACFVSFRGTKRWDRKAICFLCVWVFSYLPCFYYPSSVPSDDQYVKYQGSRGL